ncbi:hypothetical protein JHK84_045036 [Glycine max]|nr:hypothetical protein JHK84_045036 [Glycine max]
MGRSDHPEIPEADPQPPLRLRLQECPQQQLVPPSACLIIRYLFLIKEDILSLPCFQNQEIIAIKAPKASCIEVPDPDEELGFRQRQHKMIVRSAIGPINLYLLSKDDRKFEDDSANRMKLMDPSWNSDSIRKRGVGLLESQHDEKKNPSERFSLQGSQAFGIQEITPTDFEMEDDYWFQSDPGVSQIEL